MPTIETTNDDGGKKRKKETVVNDFVPPQINQRPRRRYRGKDRITWGPYIEEVFYQNELITKVRDKTTDDMIRIGFCKKYKTLNSVIRKIRNYKLTVGMMRNRYNSSSLYSGQAPVFLLSFQYDEAGIITSGGRWRRYLSFEDCHNLCREFKVADPRFVEHELIVKIRDNINSGSPEWAEWSVPDDRWIASFEREIGKTAYDSVHFPYGWERNAKANWEKEQQLRDN